MTFPKEMLDTWRSNAQKMSWVSLVFWMVVTLIPWVIAIMAEEGDIIADEISHRMNKP